jgi:cysteine synthase A
MSRIAEEMVITPDVVDPARFRAAVRRAREYGVVLPTFSELANPPACDLDRIDPDEARSENLWRVNWYNGPSGAGAPRCPGTSCCRNR